MKYQFLNSSVLGTDLNKSKSINIIGAGISGLMLGYHLKKANIPFKIFEKSDKVGGILGTEKCQNGLAEKSANGTLWCPAFTGMCTDLGLDILEPNAGKKARFLVRDKKLSQMPLKMMELSNAIFKSMFSKPEKPETLRDFGERYFNKQMTDYLLEPAFLGIYNGLANELSFPATMPSLAKLLNENNSLAWGGIKNIFNSKKDPAKIPGTLSFKNGMQELINALHQHLRNDIELNATIDPKNKQNDQFVICTPAYVAKDFFEEDLNSIIGEIKYSSNVSMTLFFEKSKIKNFKEGFGCLISRKEELDILGVLFNSCIFQHRVVSDDLLSFTCIMRDFDGTLQQKNDVEMVNFVMKDLNKIFQIDGQPVEHKIFRWQKGIPIYTPTLYNNWFEINAKLKSNYKNINLFGNYTSQISIRGMCTEAYKYTAK